MTPKQRIIAILNESGDGDPEYLEGSLYAIERVGRWAIRADKRETTGKQRNLDHKKIARQALKLLQTLQNADPYVINELDLSGANICKDIGESDEDLKAVERIANAAEQSQRPRQKHSKRGYRVLARVCVTNFERCRGEPATASETGPCGKLYDAACDLLDMNNVDRRRYLSEAVEQYSGIGLEIFKSRAKAEQK